MKFVITFSSLLICLFSFAQEKESFYIFNGNWKATVADSAKFLLIIHEKEDHNWEWDYYDFWGPLLKTEIFKDHDGTELNGRTCYYTNDGNLDSIGDYRQGKKEGAFYKLDTYGNDSIRWVTRYNYHQDSLLEIVDLLADSSNRNAREKDSINNKESEYAGGLRYWQRFLMKNLQYPDRAMSKEKEGTVKVCFTVDKEGNVLDPYLLKSSEYSLDKESIRIILKSGKWVPGRKKGEIISTFKMQPIIFKLR